MGDGNGNAGSKLQGLFPGVAWFGTGYTFPAAHVWYHVVLVRTNGTTRAYVNGVQTPNSKLCGYRAGDTD